MYRLVYCVYIKYQSGLKVCVSKVGIDQTIITPRIVEPYRRDCPCLILFVENCSEAGGYLYPALGNSKGNILLLTP